MIRQATLDDVDSIIEMSRLFYETAEYKDSEPFDADTVGNLTAMLIETGVMLIAELNGTAVGMAGALISPGLFNRNILRATEIVWWVNPYFTTFGVGQALFKGLQLECKAAGAVSLQMVALSTSPKQAAMIYERAGFRHTETSFTKVF